MRTLFDEATIAARIDEMARQMARAHPGSIAQVSEVEHVEVAQVVRGDAAMPVPYVAREVDVGEVELNELYRSGDRVCGHDQMGRRSIMKN